MKVWNSKNLTDISFQNKYVLGGFISNNYLPNANSRVAIIGGGPKGAYVIERLASVWNLYNPSKFLDIVCFNKTVDFGSGPNYQTQQPDYLLMNYNLGKVDFWTEEQEQLVHDRPDLFDFLNIYKLPSESEVDQEDYCSRAVTGIYLQYCLCKVIEALPSNIRLHLIVDEVNSIHEAADGVVLETNLGLQGAFSEVMCCTGHSYNFNEESQTESISDLSKEFSFEKPQTVYPIFDLQEMNYAGKTVAVKGMGLTFVDAVLAMTEGKGGCFKRCTGKLVYRTSGRGPHEILAFSRTGLPMISRQVDLKNGDFSLRFFTQDVVDDLSKRYVKIDFQVHLLPLIEKEFRYQYVKYFLHLSEYQNFLPELTLFELEMKAVEAFSEFSPFNLEKFLEPDLQLDDLHRSVIQYIEKSVFPEKYSKVHQAQIAMSGLWREIYPLFNKLYAFGKLTGESQRYFDQNFFGKFQRVAYGPPKENMEKILALAEAGILKFELAVNPKVSIQYQDSYIKLSISKIPHCKIASAMVDARIPKAAGVATQPEYIRQLMSHLDIDFFKNGEYTTGCVELDKQGRLVKQSKICFYGTPTEGWTLDNESLSRTTNNFLSPWAKNIVNNYVTTSITKTNASYPALD